LRPLGSRFRGNDGKRKWLMGKAYLVVRAEVPIRPTERRSITGRHGADRWGLHALALEYSQRLPVAIQRLRHRPPTPVVETFLRSARTVILGSSRSR